MTPEVEKRCVRLLPNLARGCRGWSLPPGVNLQDLVQEVLLRWLRGPACTREAADGEVLALWFGIARNVLREWRRAAAAERRLRVAVAGVRGGAVAGLGLDLDAEWRGALLRWLCGWMEPEEAAILLGARWDRLTWAEACAAVGRHGDLVVEATQRKILRILSARRLQKSFRGWLVRVGVALPSFLPSFLPRRVSHASARVLETGSSDRHPGWDDWLSVSLAVGEEDHVLSVAAASVER